MILPGTPYTEIYHQMTEDLPKLNFHMKKEEQNAVKRFRKCLSFPSGYVTEYIHPVSRNKYILWFYAVIEKDDSVTYYYGSTLVLNERDGSRTLFRIKLFDEFHKMQKTRTVQTLQVFPAHFLKRYRERCWLDQGNVPPDEMALRFFGRNDEYMARLEYDKVYDQSSRYENGTAWQFKDGVSYARQRKEILPDGSTLEVVVHKTFLTETILKKNQLENITQKGWLDKFSKFIQKYVQ